MAKKKKKIINVDIKLWIFRNIKKTFKYYFKNIVYIFCFNLISFLIINNFLKVPYYGLMANLFSSPMSFRIGYYGSFLAIFYSLKVILYSNTTYTMKINGVNDVRELFVLLIKRFLPTLGTFIIYVVAVLFFGLFLIIPGILFIFYYYFAVFICALGDLNNKEKNEPKRMTGAKPLGRSFMLVKGNLLRFMTMTTIISCIVFIIYKVFLKVLLFLNLADIGNTLFNTFSFCIFDIMVIYSTVMFIKFEGIENDVIEEQSRKNMEEQVMMNQAAINNFGKSKK